MADLHPAGALPMGGNRPPVGIGNENQHPVGIFPEQTLYTEHPVLQRLALLQQLETVLPWSRCNLA